MKNSEQPVVSVDLIRWLRLNFKPITNSKGVDLRDIDYASGQYSVVEHLEAIHKRQNSAESKNSFGTIP